MNVVGKVGSFITQGMYSVATPFHPFGGAVDIVVVKQNDGTFRSTPWYIRFGKFQGVLKGAEKIVRIEINGAEANFNMYLDNSGEAYFVREVDPEKDGNDGLKDLEKLDFRKEDNSRNDDGVKEGEFRRPETDDYNDGEFDVQDERTALGMNQLERADSDIGRIFYEFQDEPSSLEDSIEFSEFSSARFDNLGSVEHVLDPQNSNSEVVLVSVDGHILTAPLSLSERNSEDVQLITPQFHLGPGEETDDYNGVEPSWTVDYPSEVDTSTQKFNLDKSCEENIDTVPSVPQLELGVVDEEHPLKHETQDVAQQDTELCIDYNFENTGSSFKRDEVFKSCLEIPLLAPQSSKNDLKIANSSLKVLESAAYPSNKSPEVPLRNDHTEESHDDSCDHSGSSLLDSGVTNHATSPDLTVEAASNEKNTSYTDNEGSESLPIQAVDVDHDSQERKDVDLPIPRKNSGDEALDSEYECGNDAEALDSEYQCGNGVDAVDSEYESGKNEQHEPHSGTSIEGLELSLCGYLLHAGMGLNAAEDAFHANRVSQEEFKLSASSIVNDENLIVKIQGKYLPWDKASHIILGMAAFGLELPVAPHDVIPVERKISESNENNSEMTPRSSRRWRLWPIPFRRVKTFEHTGSNSSNEDVYVDSGPVYQSQSEASTPTSRRITDSPRKQIIRTNVPTTDQIESLNLKEGQNMVNFIFSTRVLGSQKVEAHIYLWKWNTRIVISDVDGTITRSDVLGQFMPLVGKDWSHSGIARLFSAIKENGYQLLFLSARAIVQAYLTKSFLSNLKQDGKSLPSGPVVISPDGLFPSLYREVIRRAPHEFKIACLEDIRALFPPDYNPFYAGFGNRDTDELSYRKIGIPKGKIFIINPKGEVAINHRIDVKSYASLHTLVNDMFPPTSLVEQEDYNSWNYWKIPLPGID